MECGTVILLNGASSSGKSTLIHALQDLLPKPYLNAGIDKFIFMLPDRYLERPLWDDVIGLAVRPGETGRMLFSGMHHAIAALAHSGLNVIADHVLVEREWIIECATVLENVPTYLVGLHCLLDVLEDRERNRKNRTPGQAKAQFPIIHAFCTYDVEVDTARFTPQECAEFIIQRIQTSHPIGLQQSKANLIQT